MATYPMEHEPPKKPNSFPRLKPLGLIAVAALLAVAILLYTGGTLIEHLPKAIRNVGQAQPSNVTCVVYDRPPRTGSSTIGESLRFCLHQKGYDWGHGPWMKYHEVIPFMIARPSTKKAFVTRHIVVPFSQLRDLLDHCNKMLWVSSTRTMRERLFSKAKFDVRGKHGSSQLASDEEGDVIKNLGGKDAKEAEELYERYPYVDHEKVLKVFPDYIIRADYLDKDLEAFLKALECWNGVKSRNIHAFNASTFENRMLDKIELRFGDRRHKLMTYLAREINERGLEMAKEF